MNTRQIGAIYLIITSNKALLLKRSPFLVISSAIVFGLITQPMRIQVQSATIGIIMLLLKKSKNVRKSIPRILTFDHIPLPSDDGIPIIRQMTITIRQDLIRVSLNLSISEETIASITEIELVIAAKNTRTKNKNPMIPPAGISTACTKTFFTAEYINRRNYHKTCEKCNGCVENLNLVNRLCEVYLILCV